jgi:aryl-alcohol dehydrogenase-like predicted oxidoreductase
MNYIEFNKTVLKVSQICLGTVNYGTALSFQDSKRQISQFVDAGGNFIDTAHVYGDWEPEILGRSEHAIGEWIKETKMRDSIILASKGAHPLLNNMNNQRVNPTEIEKDLNESLEYLNTDYIDIYFLHRDDPSIPVSELLDFLSEKVKEGKIRYFGCSNWSLLRLKEATKYAIKKNITGFVCNQIMWSLADINHDNLDDKSMILMDKDTYAYHSQINLNVMAYMSIAKGYFTRRSLGEELPGSVDKIYKNSVNDEIYNNLLKCTNETGLTIMDLSLMYIVNHSFPSVPVVSFNNEQQLKDGMKCCEIKVDENITEWLNKLHKLKKFKS